MAAIRRWWFPTAFLLAILSGILYLRLQQHGLSVEEARRSAAPNCNQVSEAFRRHQSGNWLSLTASVDRLLPDSTSLHTEQRFIVRCGNGQTVLIDNDVGVGQRVPVVVGVAITLRGQFIWNDEGGLVHYTHHGGPNNGGWILFRNHLYS